MNKRDYLFLILLFVLHGACSDPSLEPETRKKHTTLKGFLSVPPLFDRIADSPNGP